ncbi:MAG: DUF1499 domain-containing protein [Pseudomonadota bacterium]
MIFFMLMNPINDICTILPPIEFEKVDKMRMASKNEYNSEFETIQKKLYPDLKPLSTSSSRDAVFNAALEVAKNYSSWKLLLKDEENFVIQGIDTTSLMKYKDDFVIRILENEDGGSLVHMRSRSRVGRSDLGKNASRITEFFAELKKQIDKP